MKNYDKKYIMNVSGLSNMINSIELTAKQFWSIKQQLDTNCSYSKSFESNDEDEENNPYVIYESEDTIEKENMTTYIYRYKNVDTDIILYYKVCKTGYRFSK